MWIEIFRTGKQTDSAGNTNDFSDDDLQEIVNKYNEDAAEQEFAAPLVKGHPKNDSPAHGWIERLARRRNRLYAKLTGLSEQIINDIEKGAFKKVSVALYSDNTLKHVGLLGAAQPAVKGLDDVKFNNNQNAIEYETKLEQLEQENVELKSNIEKGKIEKKKSKHQKFAERMISDKKLIMPAQRDNLLDILARSSESDELDNSIMNFMENIQPNELEFELPKTNINIPKSTFGDNVNEKRKKLHDDALRIMQNTPEMNYEEAALQALSIFTNEI